MISPGVAPKAASQAAPQTAAGASSPEAVVRAEAVVPAEPVVPADALVPAKLVVPAEAVQSPVAVRAEARPPSAARPPSPRALRIACTLLVFGGLLGLHRLYLGDRRGAFFRLLLTLATVAAVLGAVVARGRVGPDASIETLQRLGLLIGLAVALVVASAAWLLFDLVRLPWLVRRRTGRPD